jgi:hypothetical protein
MPRKRIHLDFPLTGAEKQSRYRTKQKAKIEALKTAQVSAAEAAALDMVAIMESIKKELQETWEPKLKAERIAAEQEAGREAARQKDKNFENGRITGICISAVFLARRDMEDMARNIIHFYDIDRETAARVLEADERTKYAFGNLDKLKVWSVRGKLKP